MILKQLRVENLRNLGLVEISPHPSLNYFTGDNGAGKTSVLESIVVLARGRSFRTTQTSELIRSGQSSLRVFAETTDARGHSHRLGLERGDNHWKARKDGRDLAQLSRLTSSLPLILLEPNSHQLVSGPPDGRRKFLDWGVFHVEHGFLDCWRRYSRALKQRNSALRGRQMAVLDSLDEVLAPLGEQLGAQRRRHTDSLAAGLKTALAGLSDRLEGIALEYQAGWSGPGLSEALAVSRERDLERGATGPGPHRADLVMTMNGEAVRTLLSRGEQKGLAAALLLSQAGLLAGLGEKPVLLLDDLISEFDRRRFQTVLERAQEVAGQVWVTGTEKPDLSLEHSLFHVKHGVAVEVL